MALLRRKWKQAGHILCWFKLPSISTGLRQFTEKEHSSVSLVLDNSVSKDLEQLEAIQRRATEKTKELKRCMNETGLAKLNIRA